MHVPSQRGRKEVSDVPPAISADEIERLLKSDTKPTMLDVRNGLAFQESSLTIPGARRIPLPHLKQRLVEIDVDNPVVAFSAPPDDDHAITAVRVLRDNGVKSAFVLRGGLTSWRDAGLDLERE
jgi:rhodanese-related sulfurtransferase